MDGRVKPGHDMLEKPHHDSWGQPLEQRISLVTLGVSDLARARRFYEEGLGWKGTGPADGSVRFIQLGCMALALWSRKSLAEDAGLEVPTRPPAFREYSLAQNLRSRAEVDEAMRKVASLGATILKPAKDTFWGGYSGYFADPDGHVWELAFNPFWTLAEDGSIRLPD